MINVAFHLLSEPSITTCGKYICRLTETAYRDQHRIYIYVESEKTAQYFNDLLWTFSDTSFIPHNIYEEYTNSTVPIQIGYTPNPKKHSDILINLTENAPSSYSIFKNILEIVPNDESLKIAGRKKYKFYTSNGCDLNCTTINPLGKSSPVI
jgi:DNA polymerase-3 subunit chi